MSLPEDVRFIWFSNKAGLGVDSRNDDDALPRMRPQLP